MSLQAGPRPEQRPNRLELISTMSGIDQLHAPPGSESPAEPGGGFEGMLPRRFPPMRETRWVAPRTDVLQPFGRTISGAAQESSQELVTNSSPFFRSRDSARSPLFHELDVREKTAAVDRFAALANEGLGASGEDGQSPMQAADADGKSVVALPLPAPLPAWLSGADELEEPDSFGSPWHAPAAFFTDTLSDTLQSSKERMASRLAARSSFDRDGSAVQGERSQGTAPGSCAPLLTILSIAGGSGKTSLAAALGRAFSCAGQRVLLADATASGLLPFYYGVTNLQPRHVRTICPPDETGSAPVDLISLDLRNEEYSAAEEWLRAELCRGGESAQRILLDTSVLSPSLLRCLGLLNSHLLVPVRPDMNSVVMLPAMEDLLLRAQSGEGLPVQATYLLNEFDAAQPLHLDVRELLTQKLGDRLLPFVIRRSTAVPEAMAEGRTVLDFAAGALVANDYVAVARWIMAQPGGMLRLPQQAHRGET